MGYLTLTNDQGDVSLQVTMAKNDAGLISGSIMTIILEISDLANTTVGIYSQTLTIAESDLIEGLL